MFSSVVQITARQCKGLQGYFLRVTKDVDSNGVDMPLPASRLKQTSDCFVQWRDKRNGEAWGLNFVSSKDAKKFYDVCLNAPVFRNRINSQSSRASTCSSISQVPPPPSFSLQLNDGRSIDVDNSKRGQRPPRIEISNSNLSDSGIGQETRSYLPSSNREKSEKSVENESGFVNGKESKNDRNYPYPDSNLPKDMDPTEYQFLKQQYADQQDANGFSEGNNLMDSLDISRELTASSGSLYVPSDFEDTSDKYSEDFDADMRPASAIVQNKQFGTTRKAGWLVVKNILIHSKKGKLEQAPNRKWKKYWVALKGIELLFYNCDEKTVTSQDLDQPSHRLDIDKCIVQAVPEHAKLDDVFSLSTKHGNAYYLQFSLKDEIEEMKKSSPEANFSTSQVEVENWIHCIHSASASAFARQRGNGDNVVQILRNEIKRIEARIEDDEKLKKMAKLQSKVVSDVRNKQTIVDQVSEWERSLENLNVDVYRFRCYLAAVQDVPVPNPQSLLRCVSRSVKHTLSKLGVFSAASFHAYISVRETLTEPPAKPEKTKRKLRGATGLKSKLLQSLKIVDEKVVEGIRNKHSPTRAKRRSSLNSTSDSGDNDSVRSQRKEHRDSWERIGNFVQVQLPNNQTTMIPSQEGMRALDIINNSCEKRNLAAVDHFLMFLTEDNDNGLMEYVIPQEQDLLQDHQYTTLKICKKTAYDVELHNPADYAAGSFGLSCKQHTDRRILVSCVDEGSPARKATILEGDEVLMVNGEHVRGSDIELTDIERILESSSVSLQLLSSRMDDFKKTRQTTENLISFLVCPPPPKTSQYEINEDTLDALIVPSPLDNDDDDAKSSRSDVANNAQAGNEDIDALLSRAEEVNIMTRQMKEIDRIEPGSFTNIKPGQRLRKIAVELLETERTYVKNLNILLERYLYPLKEETYLSRDEIDTLVCNVSEIFDFQTAFLDNLEEIIKTDKGFYKYDEISQFQNVLYGIAETFLEHVDKLKLYSTFCSCHSRAVKLLEPGTNMELQAFLEARNPKQQHSGTLESFLITPIQRILRYPLLMKEMLKLMDKESDEHTCLTEALVSVEKVANYINEMQMISETYTPLFEKLCHRVGVEPSGMGVDNLLHYGKVRWLHGGDKESGSATIRNSFIANKSKKENENDGTLFIFKKAVALVVYDYKVRKKCNSPSSSLKIKTSDEVKFKTLIPIWDVLIRDYAWSSNDTNHIWEIVDTDSQGDGHETPYMFVNKSAEEKRLFVMAIKEATKLSCGNSSPKVPPPIAAKPKSLKDKNQNSSLLPSRPAMLAGKVQRFESKCSTVSKASWNNRRGRFGSEGHSPDQTGTAFTFDNGVHKSSNSMK